MVCSSFRPLISHTLVQWFSIGGARTLWGCEKGLFGVRTSLLNFSSLQTTIHQMVQGGAKMIFSFRTGCGLQNELRTAALVEKRGVF